MKRSTSTVLLTIAIAVLAIVGALAALVGPRLYREGRSLVAPIAELAHAEQAVAALDRELPFTPPADGLVDADRLRVYLDVWDALRVQYQRWQNLVEHDHHGRAQSWQEAKAALAATRDVQRSQLEILRGHGMSPAELLWLDDAVLRGWWRKVEPLLTGKDRPAVAEQLRRTSEDDLRFVAELERLHGRSPATTAIRQRLEQRLAASAPEAMPELPDVPASNQRLFWRHRQRIAAIGSPSDYPLHELLRGHRQRRVNPRPDGDGAPERRPEAARP
jgi:hypothetical protein